jgi:hypothetical protein
LRKTTLSFVPKRPRDQVNRTGLRNGKSGVECTRNGKPGSSNGNSNTTLRR